MKLSTFDMGATRWGEGVEADAMGFRITTARGEFDIRETEDGTLRISIVDGVMRLAPIVANVVEVDAYMTRDGRRFPA